MDDNFHLYETLDCLCWIVLHDPRVKHLRLRRDALRVAVRLADHTGTPLADDMRIAATDLLKRLDLSLQEQYQSDSLAAVFARLNPMLIEGRGLSDLIAPDMPFHKITNLRYAPRRARYKSYPGQRQRSSSRRLHSSAEPIHHELGHYYNEMYAPDDVHPNAAAALDHKFSPWYIFHAWAWGRRLYAAWLDDHEVACCHLSNLTPALLRQDNPEDGTGIAWLYLATQFVAAKVARGQRSIALPVPGYDTHAHQLSGCGFYEPGTPRTSVTVLLRELNKERELRGLPKARVKRRRLEDVNLREGRTLNQLTT